jgi:hypothetical protein
MARFATPVGASFAEPHGFVVDTGRMYLFPNMKQWVYSGRARPLWYLMLCDRVPVIGNGTLR